jgi:hypothetical protein
MSIYREEAMDTLISCLRNSEFPTAQIEAAETIVSLQGSFSASGKPLTRAFLLKRAGLDKKYQTLMRMEQLRNIPREFEETTVSLFKNTSYCCCFFSFISLCLLYFCY